MSRRCGSSKPTPTPSSERQGNESLFWGIFGSRDMKKKKGGRNEKTCFNRSAGVHWHVWQISGSIFTKTAWTFGFLCGESRKKWRSLVYLLSFSIWLTWALKMTCCLSYGVSSWLLSIICARFVTDMFFWSIIPGTGSSINEIPGMKNKVLPVRVYVRIRLWPGSVGTHFRRYDSPTQL